MLIVGVCLQLLAVALFIAVVGRSFPSKVGFYFVAAAICYHCLSELIGIVSGSVWISRQESDDSSIATWSVIVGLSLLCFVGSYLFVNRILIQSSKRSVDSLAVKPMQNLPWIPLLILGIGTLYVGLSGMMATPHSFGSTSSLEYLIVGFGRDLIWFAPALGAIGLLWVMPRTYYWPIFVILLGLCVLIGSRSIVIAAGSLTLLGAHWVGIRIGWPRAICTLLLTAVLASGVSLIRVGVGREAFVQAEGLPARVALIWNGMQGLVEANEITPLPSTSTRTPSAPLGAASPASSSSMSQESLKVENAPVAVVAKDTPEPLGQRLDGNSIAGHILAEQLDGTRSIGISSILWELRLAIPNFLYRDKLSTPIEERGAKALFKRQYRLLPPNFPDDFLVTQMGALLAYGGVILVLLGGMLLGTIFGLVDVWLAKRSIFSIVVGMGLLLCAISYEQTLYVYATVGRTVIFVLLFIGLTSVPHQLRPALRRRWRCTEIDENGVG